MKIYFDGTVFYTKERFLEMVRSNAEYIVDPWGTYYSNQIGYAKETVSIDGCSCKVFKTEQLDDEELISLLPVPYGGFIKGRLPKDLALAIEYDNSYSITKVREIEVKE